MFTSLVSVAALSLAWSMTHPSRPSPVQGQIRVVFKADDMGAAHAINMGTIEAYKKGVITSTDVIVPGPWFLEAAKLLKENSGLDVGVHLCLTSEWEVVKWRPLTAGKSFVDRDGYFFPMVWPNKNFPPGSFLIEAKPDLAEIERELRAQIETAKRHIPRVSFLSCHMGAASATPELRAITEKLSREYKLPVQDFQKAAQWMRGGYVGTDSGPEKARKLAAALEKLMPGTYIQLDHAALDTPEMRAIGHEGYRNVAQDRWANVQAWTSEEVKEVIHRKGIKRIAVRDLFAAEK